MPLRAACVSVAGPAAASGQKVALPGSTVSASDVSTAIRDKGPFAFGKGAERATVVPPVTDGRRFSRTVTARGGDGSRPGNGWAATALPGGGYQVSTLGRRLPGVCHHRGVGSSHRVAIQRRVSTGSMTSSISKYDAMLMPRPRSYAVATIAS